jgi:hypothetical protein
MLTVRHRLAVEEDGSVLMFFGLALPVIFLLLAMAMDFGNWYVHKRQLQNRADAGAFAAGLAYATEFSKCTRSATMADAEDAIRTAARQYAGDLTVAPPRFNAFPGDGSEGLTVTATDHPCELQPPDDISPGGGYWTDVRVVAGEVPSFFSGFGVPKPKISASARTQLMTAATASGMRPLAIADCVSATFIRPNGGLVGTVDLPQVGSTTWAAANTVGMPEDNVSVSINAGCGGNRTTYAGMAFVRRVADDTVSPPRLEDFHATPATPCTNPFFIPAGGQPCTFNVTAKVSFPAGATDRVVRAQIGLNAVILQPGPGPDEYTGGPFTVTPNTGTLPNGLIPITIETSVTGVQGPFTYIGDGAQLQAGSAIDQGPIVNVQLANHTVASGSPVGSITVTLGSTAAETTDKRLIDAAVDCGPPTPLTAAFATGCTGPFETAASACTQTASDGGATTPYDCVGSAALTSLSASYNALWAEGGQCSANRYTGPESDLIPGDPRLITVFVTGDVAQPPPYRIGGFAAFYVTGWFGADPDCVPAGDPGKNEAAPAGAAAGSVWGHVIPNYVIPSSQGSASHIPCAPGSKSICVAALVK